MLLRNIEISDEMKDLLSHFKGGYYDYNNENARFVVENISDAIQISYNHAPAISFAGFIVIVNNKIIEVHTHSVSYRDIKVDRKEIEMIESSIMEGKTFFDNNSFDKKFYIDQINKKLEKAKIDERVYQRDKNELEKVDKTGYFASKHTMRMKYIENLERQLNEKPSLFWK